MSAPTTTVGRMSERRPPAVRRSARHRWTPGRVVVLVVVTLHVLVVLFPFVWMLYSSLKTQPQFIKSVWSLPTKFDFAAYSSAWSGGELLTYARNSLLVTAGSVLLTVAAATAAGFALAVYRPRWMPGVEMVLLLAMAIPAYVALVPLVLMLRDFGLLDSYLGLILPTAAFNIPVSVFIMRSFFVTLPTELLEAARVDGASDAGVFFRVAVPLARPAMYTTAIINSIWAWNDFLFPLVFINTPTKQTLAVGLTQFQGEHVTNYPVLLAAIVLSALATFVIYAAFQRQVVGGLTSGAVKQ
jgi:ABC-type glycerol-3-phosphate transport system permease component